MNGNIIKYFIIGIVIIGGVFFTGRHMGTDTNNTSKGANEATTSVVGSWKWMSAVFPYNSVVTPKKVDDFVLSFHEDGTFLMTTDCNDISGGYALGAKKDGYTELEFVDIVHTEMYCGEEVQQGLFLGILGDVVGQQIIGQQLTLLVGGEEGDTAVLFVKDMPEVLPVEPNGGTGAGALPIGEVGEEGVKPDEGVAISNPKDIRISGGCVVGGCSGQICGEEGNGLVSTCEWREEYACYANARCERQSSGACGWTETTELKACISSKGATSEQFIIH